MKSEKKRWILGGLLVLAALVCAWLAGRPFGTKNEEIDETLNLLYNASFEEIDGDGMPAGWIEGKWYWDSGVSMLSISDEAYSGERSIMVYSAGENDARYTQTISVSPNSYYRISAMVKAEGCGVGRNGAGISVEDTFVSSEYAYDTEGEWTRLTLYGKTGAGQTYMTVMARIGGYGSLNVGKAWFDDMEVVQLKERPEGVDVVSFATNAPTSESSDESEEESASVSSIMMKSILFMALMMAAVALMRQKERKNISTMVMGIGCALAVLLRIFYAVSIRGYEVDMNCFIGWASRMVEYGPSGFYDSGWCDYPPGYMLILWILGWVRRLLGLTSDGPATWLLFKSVPIVCDFLLGVMIWKLARKKLGDWRATILSLVYLLNPATILNSSAWGQVDSVLTFLLALAVYCVLQRRWVKALSIYAVAVLIKPQALMFGPIGLFAVIMEVIDDRKSIKSIVMGVLSMLAVILLVLTPFALGQGKDPISWGIELYGGTLSSYPYATVNACNLYSLLGKNWVQLSESGWIQYLAWGMYGLAFVYAFFLYAKSKKSNRKNNLFLVCAVMLTLVFAFGAKMHERYLFPAMALLLIDYIINRDVRSLLAMMLATVGQFINGALVLENTHLQSDQAIINGLASVFNIAGALVTAWEGWDVCVRGSLRTLSYSEETRKASAGKTPRRTPIVGEDHGLHLRAVDYVIMAAITVIYSVVAFINLGTMQAPQTAWTSTLGGETVVFDLGETRSFHMTYYGGICNSSFLVSFSEDNEVWSEEQLAIYDQGEIFRWLWYVPAERGEDGDFDKLESGYPMQTARYVSIKAEKAGLVLHEVGFLDENGEALSIQEVFSYGGDGERADDPALLIDEQDTIPAYPSYYNSTYFDEIYHARTAYEHQNGLRPYETTHPPLGKVLIMLGIEIFGMTPFGWRFMGTLLGCLMLPIMYLLTKQLLKKTEYAALATFLLAVDCMHFTQTRIATIDTYGVFFILLMYLFMFRYCQMNFFVDDFKKTLVPLGLSGIFMGLGVASKWICIYAAAGLAILFFYTLGRRYLEYRSAVRYGGKSPEEDKARKYFWKYFVVTGAFCVVFFIVIPLLIYYFSYYWYMKPMGGLSIERVWNAQVSMFKYHSGLTNDTHFFRSPWYEWPLIVRPIWYFSGTEFMPDGVISSISCMGNPAVWWSGAAAMLFVLIRLIGPAVGRGLRAAQLAPEAKICNLQPANRNYLYVAIAFAAQYVPWMLVPRSMFIYHYFASVPFIIVAIAMVDEWLKQKKWRWRKAAFVALTLAALVLFIAFYPLMSGTPVSRDYAMYLRWFNWYNF